MTQVTGIELVVEGRTFVQDTPTFEQEMFIMQQVMECGLDQPHIKLNLDPENNQDLERPVRQLIVEAYKSGTLFKLLGAMVTEKGTEWTPEQAAETASLFKNTRDPKAKAQLHPALVGAILAFFESAGSLGPISPISSEGEESSRPVVSVKPRKISEKTAEEAFHSGNMSLLSEKSPSTKVSRSKKSFAGKSVKG